MATLQKTKVTGVSKLRKLLTQITVRGKKKGDLKKLIGDNNVLVLSKSWCPYCAEAKKILKSYNLTGLTILELDEISEGSSLQSEALSLTGQRTVPSIWIGGKHIGGCDDLRSIPVDTLKQKLTDAGALV
mmetsp:Transcript_1768/g.2092  ORF Transcript_1768/g.2092 Transcript_1768/m.2092 type:complete len:130 (+) Transcript_1768:142-531(+)